MSIALKILIWLGIITLGLSILISVIWCIILIILWFKNGNN